METVGWIIVVFGLLTAFPGFAGCVSGDFLAKPLGILSFAIGLVTAALGYLIVANGHVISCFVSMEENIFPKDRSDKTVKILNGLNENLLQKSKREDYGENSMT